MNEKHRYMLCGMSSKTTKDLLSILGVEVETTQGLSLESIIGHVPDTHKEMVLASMELYERNNRYPTSVMINGVKDSINVVKPLFYHGEFIEVWVVSLTNQNTVRGVKCASYSSDVSKNSQFLTCRVAVEDYAQKVIVAYNTLRDDPTATAADIEFAKGVRDALKCIEVGLVDVIIASKNGKCFSFAEEKVIE